MATLPFALSAALALTGSLQLVGGHWGSGFIAGRRLGRRLGIHALYLRTLACDVNLPGAA